MKTTNLHVLLLVTAALSTVPGHALAQSPAAEAPGTSVLDEIVVTATRRSESVNRVPMSITAVTQESLDAQGIKNVSDLQRSVPGLNIRGVLAGVQTISIRGIVQNGATAATTGVYLDDIPLQKRNSQATVQNNGTPAPPLFDLERVEVLRGPQGTLFGGSSEGGTIRFITPQPSLTDYSGVVRSEFSNTEHGGNTYEIGAAVGGPIVRDKLGFRAAIFKRQDGGYTDLIDQYTRANRWPDANSTATFAVRAALLWAPNDNTKVTFSVYGNSNSADSIISSASAPVNRTLTVPSACFNRVAAGAVSATPNPAAIPCPATIPATVYFRPSQSYGPYNFEPFQNIVNGNLEPAESKFWAPSLTVDYSFGSVDAKSITSYIYDSGEQTTYETTTVGNITGYTDRAGNFYQPGATVSFAGTANVTAGAIPFSPVPDYQGVFQGTSRRKGIIQEFRFSSSGDPKPFSWVAGLYYSDITGKTKNFIHPRYNEAASAVFGFASGSQRYTELIPLAAGQTCANLGLPAGTNFSNVAGACRVGLSLLPGGLAVLRDQELTDTDVAAFGELNYWPTDKLKITGGIRFTNTKFEYFQTYLGPYSGTNTPTAANGGITVGKTKESPITPKLGVAYEFTDRHLVYANAAKGYRAGGVNVPLVPGICAPVLTPLGLDVSVAPRAYNSDSVMSYEAGGKFRVSDNWQVNTSVYRTDWKDVQQVVSLVGCAIFTVNVGKAVSQGVDFSAAGQILPGLTGNLDVGYIKAEYTTPATGPLPTTGAAPLSILNKGDTLPVSPWTVSMGLQYDVTRLYRGFFRINYQYTSSRLNGSGPGTATFSPDAYNLPSAQLVNARAGVSFRNGIDLNTFVNNLLNSTDALDRVGGRSQCGAGTGAGCATFTRFNPFLSTTTFRPRTIGVQLNYRM